MSNHANLSWNMTHLTQGAPHTHKKKKKKKKKKRKTNRRKKQRHAMNFVI